MSGDALRELTEMAMERGGTSEARLAALDGLVKARWGAFDLYPIVLNAPPDLSAEVFPIYLRYRTLFAERLRKMEPTNAIPFIPAVSVHITPKQFTSPDVIKVVVFRNGKEVQPISSTLTPRTFQNALGGVVSLHAGVVAFPQDAFAPGGLVVVTLIPEVGDNMVTPLKVEWLARFK
jgi:hypothetical protein